MLLLWVRVDPKQRIERAITDQPSNQGNQADPSPRRLRWKKDEEKDDDTQQHTNDTIDGTHIIHSDTPPYTYTTSSISLAEEE